MKKENFILKIYSITLTLILGFIFVSGFKSSNSNERFTEITVERINVIEPDGKLKMVISNQKCQHPGMMNGEAYEARDRAPGILFFNEEQDEVGGLGYSGSKEEGGNNVYLSIDQYKNDQVMQLMHYTNNDGDNRYGLLLWERDKKFTMPMIHTTMDSLDNEGFNYRQKLEYMKIKNGGEPITAQRMFIGNNYNRETGLFIQDKFGVDRLRFYVDSNNSPKIEVLDEKGTIIKNILEK